MSDANDPIELEQKERLITAEEKAELERYNLPPSALEDKKPFTDVV